MFLEKTKLKDFSGNDADWIRDRPIAGADADVMNVLTKARYDDYLIV